MLFDSPKLATLYIVSEFFWGLNIISEALVSYKRWEGGGWKGRENILQTLSVIHLSKFPLGKVEMWQVYLPSSDTSVLEMSRVEFSIGLLLSNLTRPAKCPNSDTQNEKVHFLLFIRLTQKSRREQKCFLFKISSKTNTCRNSSSSPESCAVAYPYGHPWNGQWWSAPWCHQYVPWTTWLAPPFPPPPPDNGREALSHPQPVSAGMWWVPMAPQRHPVHRSLQREVDHLISVAFTLINTKYFVVIAVNCNTF